MQKANRSLRLAHTSQTGFQVYKMLLYQSSKLPSLLCHDLMYISFSVPPAHCFRQSQAGSLAHLTILLTAYIVMRFSTFAFTASALLAPAVIAAALPRCSTNSPLSCQCPKDTAYDQAVTISVIGAAARDVTALISDCKFYDACLIQFFAALINNAKTSSPNGSVSFPFEQKARTINLALYVHQTSLPTTALMS